jgi:hypothetical protein
VCCDKRPRGPPIECVLVEWKFGGTFDAGDSEFRIQLPKGLGEPTQIRPSTRRCDVDIPSGIWGTARLGASPPMTTNWTPWRSRTARSLSGRNGTDSDIPLNPLPLQSIEAAAGSVLRDLPLWDPWAVARSHDDVETWLQDYRELGRVDLSAPELRRLHTAWTSELLLNR